MSMENVAIIGGGFTGIHNAVLFARKGFNVTIVENDEKKVEIINSYNKEILHVKEEYVNKHWESLKERISATPDVKVVEDCKYVVINVNTPLKVVGERLIDLLKRERKVDRYIDFKPLDTTIKNIAKWIKPGTLISSEVTIYPNGTIERVFLPLVSESDISNDLYVVHVPERLNPDDKRWNPENITRVIGGVNSKSLRKGIRLYRDCLGLTVHPVKDIRIAELSKIQENTFRFINIVYASLLNICADSDELDFYEVVKASSTKPFGYVPFYPGYAGGACLVKDALMLYLWLSRKERNKFAEFIRLALEINEYMPTFMAKKIVEEARKKKAKRILFYGIGFKPGSKYFVSRELNPIARTIDKVKEMIDLKIKVYDPRILEKSDFKDENEALQWADLVYKWG